MSVLARAVLKAMGVMSAVAAALVLGHAIGGGNVTPAQTAGVALLLTCWVGTRIVSPWTRTPRGTPVRNTLLGAALLGTGGAVSALAALSLAVAALWAWTGGAPVVVVAALLAASATARAMEGLLHVGACAVVRLRAQSAASPWVAWEALQPASLARLCGAWSVEVLAWALLLGAIGLVAGQLAGVALILGAASALCAWASVALRRWSARVLVARLWHHHSRP